MAAVTEGDGSSTGGGDSSKGMAAVAQGEVTAAMEWWQ